MQELQEGPQRLKSCYVYPRVKVQCMFQFPTSRGSIATTLMYLFASCRQPSRPFTSKRSNEVFVSRPLLFLVSTSHHTFFWLRDRGDFACQQMAKRSARLRRGHIENQDITANQMEDEMRKGRGWLFQGWSQERPTKPRDLAWPIDDPAAGRPFTALTRYSNLFSSRFLTPSSKKRKRHIANVLFGHEAAPREEIHSLCSHLNYGRRRAKDVLLHKPLLR